VRHFCFAIISLFSPSLEKGLFLITHAGPHANKLIDKFRIQPNMPLDFIQHEVKEKWKVDEIPSMMYRARKNENKKIHGKLED
jgi:hypothetical protein